jgi:dTDP-glucose 4,6-dehydratase
MVRVLVTGGAGFIGHHLCEHILKTTDWEVVSLDRLDTSGNLNRLADLPIWRREKGRVKVVFHDLRAELNGQVSAAIGPVDYVFHLAAASHVDRSIEHPMDFVLNNVVGTCNLLDWARNTPSIKKLLYFSTDEVFGPAPPGVQYREWDRYRSTNPYSASKAGGEELCVAYHNTYGLPVLISHTMNVFGERQHPEKFIPGSLAKIISGEKVLIHASPTGVPGSRFYIHARNVAAAAMHIVTHGVTGEKYNIVGEVEVDNLELAKKVAKIVGKRLKYELVDFHSSRPGHDLRYALDGAKMRDELGWKLPVSFDTSLERTLKWTLNHPQWLQAEMAAAA